MCRSLFLSVSVCVCVLVDFKNKITTHALLYWNWIKWNAFNSISGEQVNMLWQNYIYSILSGHMLPFSSFPHIFIFTYGDGLTFRLDELPNIIHHREMTVFHSLFLSLSPPFSSVFVFQVDYHHKIRCQPLLILGSFQAFPDI